MKFDFSGWATKNDLQCSDGRVIRHGAFEECDGKVVPLVWQHLHDSPDNILGHALLENRDEGVYAYGTFNETPTGQLAKEIVKHGDIASLSIYANRLKQQGSNVLHGAIREVSLVLAGANPGAVIDNLAIAHSDGYEDVLEDEAVIYNGLDQSGTLYHLDREDDDEDEEIDEDVETEEDNDIETDEDDSVEEDEENEDRKKMAIKHADGDKTIEDVFSTMSDEQQQAAYAIIGLALSQEGIVDEDDAEDAVEMAHADDDEVEDMDGASIQEIFETMNDEQKDAIYAVIGMALQEQGNGDEDEDDEGIEHSYKEDLVMKHNVFDGTAQNEGEVLSHAETMEIFSDAKRIGSLKDAVLEHGITNIDVFFPDYQQVGDYPAMISRPMEWVAEVLGATHKTPFSKVRSVAANITAEEARAKGYIKGNQKVEEQISALKRTTDPTTIYKLQKLDRDDIVDITDFDVVAWLKQEMRVMLDEEAARAILIGDGRTASSNDKIDETKIRPVWTDVDTYTIHEVVNDSLTGQARAEAFIDKAIRARKNYKGSGSPTLYVGTDLLTEMRLIRDKMGHRLYKNDQELADELRVSKIVEIQLFDDQSRTEDGSTFKLGGIIVNLADYNCGATKGGEVNLFDDFDLDYNKYEYLIETRMSGALVQPYSAIAIDFGTVSGQTGETGETNG